MEAPGWGCKELSGHDFMKEMRREERVMGLPAKFLVNKGASPS
jgi:hypothetical protein